MSGCFFWGGGGAIPEKGDEGHAQQPPEGKKYKQNHSNLPAL